MMIFFCNSCQPEKEECAVKNGICQGNCRVPLYNDKGQKVEDATCQALTINGKSECGCFLRWTGGESCVRDPQKGCVEVKPCPIFYKDKDKKEPVKGVCMETPGECNCLYKVR